MIISQGSVATSYWCDGMVGDLYRKFTAKYIRQRILKMGQQLIFLWEAKKITVILFNIIGPFSTWRWRYKTKGGGAKTTCAIIVYTMAR